MSEFSGSTVSGWPRGPLFDSAEGLYNAIEAKGGAETEAVLMLHLRSWLTGICEELFDPETGEAEPVGLSGVLEKAGGIQGTDVSSKGQVVRDRVYRIFMHAGDALEAIMQDLRNKILREHSLMPVYATKEVDSVSVQWLSRRPGRTIRQKLSGKPYLLAVRRRESFDTSENRLLKAFVSRLEQLLIGRLRHEQLLIGRESLNSADLSDLILSLQRWLHSDEAAEIKAWDNLPPNNTLLQERRYRKVWDGWLWIQRLDEDIRSDHGRLQKDFMTALFWSVAAGLMKTGRVRWLQQPVLFDYDNFALMTLQPAGVLNVHLAGYVFPQLTADSRPSGIISQPEEISGDYKAEGEIRFIWASRTTVIRKEGDAVSVVSEEAGYRELFEPALTSIGRISLKALSLILGVPGDELSKMKGSPGIQPVRSDSAVIDICSTRPMFAVDSGPQRRLPFRLIQQYWDSAEQGMIPVDCGNAGAINLSHDIATMSMFSLFGAGVGNLGDRESGAAMFFARRIREQVDTDSLTYLVPDSIDDFSLQNIRKYINYNYSDSSPLPRSIAAIFAWQSSDSPSKSMFKLDDIIVVLDQVPGGISFTPIRGRYDKKLKAAVSESDGICWERHPTIVMESHYNAIDKMKKSLRSDGCPVADKLMELFGFDGLIDESAGLSVVGSGSKWYHLPAEMRHLLTKDFTGDAFRAAAINEVRSMLKCSSKTLVFLLPLDNTIAKPDLDAKAHWLGSSWSLIKGSQILSKWQKKAGKIALWRDHLPELSVKMPGERGLYEHLYLVKDKTVVPQKETVPLIVEKNFRLPAGSKDYSFPLFQGTGNQALQFAACLKSQAFPLREDVACKLDMKYTYGADDPYELQFLPLDPQKAGFKSVRVEWRPITAEMYKDPRIPDFPQRNKWADFYKVPKDKGEGTSDLIEWFLNKLLILDEATSQLLDPEVLKNRRKCGEFKNFGSDNTYFFVEVTGEDIYCRSSELIEPVSPGVLYPGRSVYLDIEQRDKSRRVGLNISFEQPCPQKLLEKVAARVTKAIFDLRFPGTTIWNYGRSPFDSDVPEEFRRMVLRGVENAVALNKSDNTPNGLKNELFLFLCYLHKDAPALVRDRLLNVFMKRQNVIKELRNHWKGMAFAIGSCETDWQRDLLSQVVKLVESNDPEERFEGLKILSIAFWRNEKLVKALSYKDAHNIIHKLYASMESGKGKIDKYRSKKHIAENLYNQDECSKLKLLLALLRTRASVTEEVRAILSPEQDIAKKYTSLIDDITRKTVQQDLKVKSYITLELDKPAVFKGIPDLLYALRMYLTGDSGANSIRVTAVSEGDD